MNSPELLDLQAWQARRAEYDAAVLSTDGAMKVCSSSIWQASAHAAFGGRRAVHVWHCDGHFALFAASRFHGDRLALEPLEALWGFGCPLVGPSAATLASLFECSVRSFHGAVQFVRVGGIDVHSELRDRLLGLAGGDFDVEEFEGGACDRADLSDGVDPYLARRDAAFRSNLRRLGRRCAENGIQVEYCGAGVDGAAAFGRVLALEARSWKAAADAGFRNWQGGEAFYRNMTLELANARRLRAAFARHDGRDVAYAFGGIVGKEYRGFQLGYDVDYAKFGLGHVVQLELARRLADEGVRDYDLGMTMPYKARWRDHTTATVQLVLRVRN